MVWCRLVGGVLLVGRVLVSVWLVWLISVCSVGLSLEFGFKWFGVFGGVGI